MELPGWTMNQETDQAGGTSATANHVVFGIHEAAAFLGVHEQTIRRLARRGAIPSFKAGRDWRFRKEALLRWEARQQDARRCSVLVDDDEPAVRTGLSKVVTRLGCTVRETADGAEGLTLIAREIPDVVLLDLLMPTMNGVEFLAELRKTLPGLPVVIITGYPESDLVARAAPFAPILLLTKPVDPTLLEHTMRSLVADKMVSAAGAVP